MSGVCQLFVTCLVDGFSPGVGVATVRLLERVGYDVAFPFDQTCCGQPAFNAGYLDQAIAMAEHTVEVLDATYGPIVVPSGSCGDMLIHHTPKILTGQPSEEAAKRVAARTVELTRFLTDNGVTVSSMRSEHTVAFHRSCHGLRGLGLAGVGEGLLDSAGVSRCELEGADECCGFGGLFSIEMPEISSAMLDTKLKAIEASGAEVVVGGDVSCLMHIEGGLHRRGSTIRTKHIAEVLAGEEA
ncbi:MAG: (Fe-S)-binding protein [Acidimicrobiia bacterium]